MRGKAEALIGLEHIICRPILLDQRKIRVQNARGIIHLVERGVRRTIAMAGFAGGSVHSADAGRRVEIAHGPPIGMRVPRIVVLARTASTVERHWTRIRRAASGGSTIPWFECRIALNWELQEKSGNSFWGQRN